MTDRVVIVHDYAQCCEALSAAHAAGKPITVQSAPDAIYYAGSLYLKNMFVQAQKKFPKTDARFVIDCADTGAEAIDAIRSGHTHIRSSANRKMRKKIADIAKQHGVTMLDNDYELLDLNHTSDTKSAGKKVIADREIK